MSHCYKKVIFHLVMLEECCIPFVSWDVFSSSTSSIWTGSLLSTPNVSVSCKGRVKNRYNQRCQHTTLNHVKEYGSFLRVCRPFPVTCLSPIFTAAAVCLRSGIEQCLETKGHSQGAIASRDEHVSLPQISLHFHLLNLLKACFKKMLLFCSLFCYKKNVVSFGEYFHIELTEEQL